MDNQNKEILEATLKEILAKMDFSGGVAVEAGDGEMVVVKIESEEAGLLIGQAGESLAALQHLARIVANKKAGGVPVNFIVDVNNYRANRLELLREMALDLAKQVAQEKSAKVLEPMPSYERRLIHLALKDFKGVKTESQGEGEERRVIIKSDSEFI